MLKEPVVAGNDWTATDDSCTAEHEILGDKDDVVTPNETKTVIKIDELADNLEANEESLIQKLWEDDEWPNREDIADTSIKPNLKPKRVTKTDPEVDFQNKSIDETLTGEKLATKVVLEERRAAVTNNDSPVP